MKVKPGMKKVMGRFKALPEAREIHLKTGKVEVEKSYVHPPPQHTDSLAETRIAKLGAVHGTPASLSNRS